MSDDKTKTVFDAILESLEQAAEYNKNDVSKPAAILWTDKDSQWLSLADKLRAALPHFLTLGDYEPDIKKGPGIWVRCMIAKTLDTANWPDEVVPIIYMPDVSRQELRAVGECPEHLKPVVELQFRGAFWTQKNAKDWTILSFLQSKDGGLGLDIAHDNKTKDAMSQALVKLAETPICQLQNRKLEAEDFYALVQPDPVRDILLWMNDPDVMKRAWSQASYEAFRNRCKENYGFEPERDGVLVAAEKLGLRMDNWKIVWARFAEAPQNYQNIPDLLKRARPAELFAEKSSWPQDNNQEEDKLRNELLSFSNLNPGQAREKIIQLESQHSQRRQWVWAKLGQARLAYSLKHLNELALVTSKPLPTSSLETMTKAYTEQGYKADLAVLEAIACCDEAEPRDISAVTCAIRSLYMPYLRDCTEQFQKLADSKNLKKIAFKKNIEAEESECILFADGLRFDVAVKLRDTLKNRDIGISVDWILASIPSVTATAKPAISPISELLSTSSDSDDFVPTVAESQKPLTNDNLHKLLEMKGYQILESNETGDPEKKAWTEHGEIDSFGHKHGIKLAHHILTEIGSIANRIFALLKAGYRKVKIITDHGWLLMPGDLPKADLPYYLTNTRWGRCANIKENVVVDFPTQPWHFNKNVQVASPHGIDVFYGGMEYSHGGLSLQEMIVPVLTATLTKKKIEIQISSVKWVGLRCRIELTGEYSGCGIDIRTKPADTTTSLTRIKSVAEDGTASLLVEDDKKIGETAAIVVIDAQGQVLKKQVVIIGS
jgi:hypothetical protein